MKKRILLKRILIGLGILCLLAGASACGEAELEKTETKTFEENEYILRVNNVGNFDVKGDYQYQEGTDWDWSYLTINNMSRCAKGEKGYYVRLGYYIYYCDFESGTLTPLCNRPECLHDKEIDEEKKKDCIAYVPWGSLGEGIQYYDGKLYINAGCFERRENEASFSGDQLYTIAEDGSSREVTEFRMEDCCDFIIHRGAIYYTSQVTDPQTMVNTQTVYRLDMKTNQQTELAQLEGMPVFRIFPYGDYVYITIRAAKDDIVPQIVYEISTGKTKVIEGEWKVAFFPEDENHFLVFTEIEEDAQKVESVSMDGNERETIGEITLAELEKFGIDKETPREFHHWISVDDSYLYVNGSVDGNRVAVVYNRENCELLQVFMLESDPSAQFIGWDDTYMIYICDEEYSGVNKIYWMKKEDMLNPGAVFSVIEP